MKYEAVFGACVCIASSILLFAMYDHFGYGIVCTMGTGVLICGLVLAVKGGVDKYVTKEEEKE